MSQETLISDFQCSNVPVCISGHRHTDYQLLYMKEGVITIEIAGKTYEPPPGSLVFISNLETHTIRIESKRYVRYFLNIQPALADTRIKDPRLLSVFFRRTDAFCHVLPVSPYEKTVEALLEKIGDEFQTDDKYTNELCAAYLKELLIFLYRKFPSFFPLVDQKQGNIAFFMKQYIEQNFQREMTLESLSEAFHFSACYLAHAFKQYTGYSTKQYLLLCRLNEAKRRLTETDDSIITVAFEAGFTDHSNFTRYFKQKTGLSPSEYRKEYVK